MELSKLEKIDYSRLYDLEEVAFNDLSDALIEGLTSLVFFWRRENAKNTTAQGKNWYIHDRVDFRQLRGITHRGKGIGRVFLLYKKEGYKAKTAREEKGKERELLAYILCFDKTDFIGTSTQYMNLLSPFIPYDSDLMNYAIDLSRIALIYHIARARNTRKKHYGYAILKMVMAELKTKKRIDFVVTSLDSGQTNMINYLKSARPGFFFFNYDLRATTSKSKQSKLRLFGGEVLNQHSFRKSIEDKLSKKNIDFIIRMQLNLATESLRRMFKETGVDANIVWTSFFHQVPELHDLYDMDYVYHGFYDPLAEMSAYDESLNKTRTFHLEVLKDVKHYFEKKHNASTRQVASLNPSLRSDRFEFFFINDNPENHDFGHFTNPQVYNITEKNSLSRWLVSNQLVDERRRMTDKEKQDWEQKLAAYVRIKNKPSSINYRVYANQWEKAQEAYLILPDEASQLEMLQVELSNQGGGRIEAMQQLKNKINARLIPEPTTIERWRAWWTLHDRLYQSDFKAVRPELRNNTFWCHAVVPMAFSGGVVGIMFTFTCKRNPLHPSRRYLASLAEMIASTLSRNMFTVVNDVYRTNFNIALSRFTTASLSARNLSHNIGSHVYSFLGQPNVLSEAIWGQVKNIPPGFSQEKGILELTNFFKFTNVRMSLLADMVTNEPVASTSLFLKKDILQELDDQPVLKRFIKGVNDRKISILYYNKDAPDAPRKRDVRVQIPNGNLGKSAFLMIVVNFLRNSIKYSPHEVDKDIKLTLNIQTPRFANNERKSERFLEVTLHDNVPLSVKQAESTASKINREYIDKKANYNREFNLSKTGLGFAEMRAAARYLMKKPFSNSWVATQGSPYDYIRAVTTEKKGDKQTRFLGIRFFLKRPRPLLLIDDNEKWNEAQEQLDVLSSKGIKVRTLQELSEWNSESFAHEVGIILARDLPESISSVAAFTPRIIRPRNPQHWRELFQQPVEEKNSEPKTQALIAKAWEYWINQLREKHPTFIPASQLPVVSTGQSLVNSDLNRGILFDDHASYLESVNWQREQLSYLGFYEFYREQTTTGNFVREMSNTKDEHYRQQIEWLLEEAARTRIVIIDERIQQMLTKQEYGQGLRPQSNAFTYLAGMGIFVPDPRIEGNPDFSDTTQFEGEEQKLLQYLTKQTENQQTDFVVIHIGLIEAIKRDSTRDRIYEWVDEHLPPSEHTEYVMISGRGKPSAIPERFRYMPYNNLSLALLEDCPSKLNVCQHLYSSRTRS